MIIDMRTYTYYPSTFRPFLKDYAEHGYAITSKYLGFNLGLFTASSTVVNRTMQWFAYKDHNHRDECRKAFLAGGDKQTFTSDADKDIRQQESRVIVPLDFSPIRTIDEHHPLLAAEECPHRFFEFTEYRCRMGTVHDAEDMLKNYIYPLAEKYAQWVIAYFRADSGTPALFEMRAYSSLQERMARNEKMSGDSRYSEAVKTLANYCTGMESVIWEPQSMSPLH